MRLSTTCWSAALGLCVCSAIRALLSSGPDVGLSRRPHFHLQFIPEVFTEDELRAPCTSTLTRRVLTELPLCTGTSRCRIRFGFLSSTECFRIQRHSVRLGASDLWSFRKTHVLYGGWGMARCSYTYGHTVHVSDLLS